MLVIVFDNLCHCGLFAVDQTIAEDCIIEARCKLGSVRQIQTKVTFGMRKSSRTESEADARDNKNNQSLLFRRVFGICVGGRSHHRHPDVTDTDRLR